MKIPRIMIAGVSSGSGKTTAVCTVLSLLKQENIAVKACKCGPDYIDPMFHKTVTGVPCANLDPFFCGEDLLGYLLCKNAGESITVIEVLRRHRKNGIGKQHVHRREAHRYARRSRRRRERRLRFAACDGRGLS